MFNSWDSRLVCTVSGENSLLGFRQALDNFLLIVSSALFEQFPLDTLTLALNLCISGHSLEGEK